MTDSDTGLLAEESADLYWRLFDLAPLPTIIHDGRSVLRANPAAAAAFGYETVQDMIGVSLLSHVHPGFVPAVVERTTALLRGESVPPLVEKFLRKDGTVLEGEAFASPATWHAQPAVHVMIRDLSEQRQTETALTDILVRYAAVVEHAPMGMHFYQVDSDGELVFTGANKAANDMLGIDHSTLVGMPILQAWPGLAGTEVPEGYRRAALEGTPFELKSIEYDDGAVKGAFETHAFQIGPGACAAMFWDIADQVRNAAELEQHRLHLEELVEVRTEALAQAHRDIDAVTIAAARAVELRDPYTAGHQRRVAELSHRVALELGLGELAAERVRVAGLTHDIGKLTIPAEILSKPGNLSAIEYELVKGHATAACEILNGADIGWPLAEIVSQHHERMDGSGYPAGLAGDDILLEARILAVADVVEAMSSHRPYRPSLGMAAAADEIARFSGELYDASVVSACLRVLDSGFEFADEV